METCSHQPPTSLALHARLVSQQPLPAANTLLPGCVCRPWLRPTLDTELWESETALVRQCRREGRRAWAIGELRNYLKFLPTHLVGPSCQWESSSPIRKEPTALGQPWAETKSQAKEMRWSRRLQPWAHTVPCPATAAPPYCANAQCPKHTSWPYLLQSCFGNTLQAMTVCPRQGSCGPTRMAPHPSQAHSLQTSW